MYFLTAPLLEIVQINKQLMINISRTHGITIIGITHSRVTGINHSVLVVLGINNSVLLGTNAGVRVFVKIR